MFRSFSLPWARPTARAPVGVSRSFKPALSCSAGRLRYAASSYMKMAPGSLVRTCFGLETDQIHLLRRFLLSSDIGLRISAFLQPLAFSLQPSHINIRLPSQL